MTAATSGPSRLEGKSALSVLADFFPATLRETACDISMQVTELDRASFARTRSGDQTPTQERKQS
ncbi:hypothetical protein ACGFYO_03850 [Streptomyces sp. NPDC048201]|uniref:hypothetical protein n=1 Tax=Streptomyces sp. NPDC048201 TaxID=3365513 RepID=UPI00371DBE1A